jgi:hypothetical protein
MHRRKSLAKSQLPEVIGTSRENIPNTLSDLKNILLCVGWLMCMNPDPVRIRRLFQT